MQFREWYEMNEGLLKRAALASVEGLLGAADKALSFVSPAIVGLASAAVAYGGWKLGAISGLGSELARQLGSAVAGGYLAKELSQAAMLDVQYHLENAIFRLNSAREKDREQEQLDAAKKILAIKKILQPEKGVYGKQ